MGVLDGVVVMVARLGTSLMGGCRVLVLVEAVVRLLGILNPIRKVGPLYNSRTHDKEMVPYWTDYPGRWR